jgi:hypothetical protein
MPNAVLEQLGQVIAIRASPLQAFVGSPQLEGASFINSLP